MLDVIALRSLVAVNRSGSVAAAADSLGYTPSAVSQQIKKLEAQSGVNLLEKFGRGVMLTEAGRLLVGRADELLRRMEEITSGLHAGSGTLAGQLRVATFATGCRGLVAGALAQLHGTAPDLDVSLVDASPGTASIWSRQGRSTWPSPTTGSRSLSRCPSTSTAACSVSTGPTCSCTAGILWPGDPG